MPPGSSLQETEPRARPRRGDPPRDAGSREHVAAHRTGARPGGGHRAEHRRHRGQAEGQRAAAASTRSSARCARKVKAAEPVLDVEFIQVLQDMIGDLTGAPEPVVVKLFSPDAGAVEHLGAAGGRRARQGDGRRQDAGRRCRGRHREHDERPGGACSPSILRSAARAGFTRRGARHRGHGDGRRRAGDRAGDHQRASVPAARALPGVRSRRRSRR